MTSTPLGQTDTTAPAATPALRPARRTPLAHDVATATVLWRRDLTRFVREKSRIAGALIQPLIFWLVIGSGMAGTFRLPGAEHVGYLEYFYPGVILMVVLFTSIFATMSVIEDRHAGFLQAVLAGPGSRTALVLGKCLGATTIALVQSALFLALAPVAGFPLGQIAWPALLAALALASLGLAALGFAVAWWLDSTQGYHVVMSLFLLPMWILSGAVFPPARGPAFMAALMKVNPMSYATAAVRRALYGGVVPAGTVVSGASLTIEILVLGAFALFGLLLAARACNVRR
jgi:daunorubicin resistance ABC transporter membrane protein